MIEIVNGTEKVKARKDHYCNYCGGLIKKGIVYEITMLKSSYIYAWKSHIECERLVSELKMEHFDEGITSDIFQDNVIEKYKSIMGYDVKLPSFPEQLKLVIETVIK